MTGPPHLKIIRLAFLVTLAISVATVLTLLGYLLFTLPPSRVQKTETRYATFNLPTASIPDPTAGPPEPDRISYNALEPITGYSNCQGTGLKGAIQTGNGTDIQDVQVVVWDDDAGLFDMASIGTNGRYRLDLPGPVMPRRLWVQLFEDDQPVSRPVPVQTQLDCEQGLQVFEIDWEKVD
jgi:hypothetical protein